MGENTYNSDRNKFWKDQSMPIAKDILDKMNKLCNELEEAGACSDDLYCWLRDVHGYFLNIPEL